MKALLKSKNPKLQEFIEIAKQYELLFVGETMDPELEEFLMLDCKYHIYLCCICRTDADKRC